MEAHPLLPILSPCRSFPGPQWMRPRSARAAEPVPSPMCHGRALGARPWRRGPAPPLFRHRTARRPNRDHPTTRQTPPLGRRLGNGWDKDNSSGALGIPKAPLRGPPFILNAEQVRPSQPSRHARAPETGVKDPTVLRSGTFRCNKGCRTEIRTAPSIATAQPFAVSCSIRPTSRGTSWSESQSSGSPPGGVEKLDRGPFFGYESA